MHSGPRASGPNHAQLSQHGPDAAKTLASEVDWGLHVHEGQRHELGYATGSALQLAQQAQVLGPVLRTIAVAPHDGGCGCQAHLMCGLNHLQPIKALSSR